MMQRRTKWKKTVISVSKFVRNSSRTLVFSSNLNVFNKTPKSLHVCVIGRKSIKIQGNKYVIKISWKSQHIFNVSSTFPPDFHCRVVKKKETLESPKKRPQDIFPPIHMKNEMGASYRPLEHVQRVGTTEQLSDWITQVRSKRIKYLRNRRRNIRVEAVLTYALTQAEQILRTKQIAKITKWQQIKHKMMHRTLS
ncbi:uncharacterized protein LOC107036879 [Diachasma alloeum]|uniref:uncharacterized protein LOC107036879 n=1 Tax=Diachasma alloeum TaxID=454923 RepID=UPI0010FBB137|nr:uncharacterized protein LOC107036879 [Diachasma alloeum]